MTTETISFVFNGKATSLDIDGQTPLLWAIRENIGLTGTKYGCGIGQCGACTVHLSGTAVRSCQLPVSAVQGQQVTTIEGIGDSAHPHPVQQAWIEANVPQCGYCQSGQIMTATALLARSPNPSDAEIKQAMNGNICRCGMYGRIRKAVHRAVELQAIGRDKLPAAARRFDPNDILVGGVS